MKSQPISWRGLSRRRCNGSASFMKSWSIASKELTHEYFHYAFHYRAELRRRIEKKTIHSVTVEETGWKALNPFFSINETGTKFFPRNCHIASRDVTVAASCVTVHARRPFTGTQWPSCGIFYGSTETVKLWLNQTTVFFLTKRRW